MDSKEIIKQNKDVYNKIAPLFASTRQNIWDDMLLFQKYLKDGYSVLDIGCGTGRLYHLLDKFQDIDYIGLDQSEGQIEMAKKDFPNTKYVLAEMTKLPFPDNSFDIIFCIATLHHLPDEGTRLNALSEMHRVLKPGGYVLLTNWNLFSDSVGKIVKKGKFKQNDAEFIIPWLSSEGEVLGERYYYGFKIKELEALFHRTGFEVEDQYFSQKGERVDFNNGHNIVSVLTYNT
ncbi:MAG: hypothetical protein COX81_03640 [Candidatus Magasanikbacteria bacterium CG_4_10_14_0_2_um_filter_37_12]|uniref:Methyltransferase type 11 domain-containing protein n=1 Tax=Candidatus Magasanikbacteria bacterium CG_4_10_14_0_2_um_filter_37_12 TaxID=1974637 RepID=A0A2M7V727_9BACT|nr:MAG: hypothetical protein COX81_03640 [Candidatus Magasanikbacteria bacterium CG_4_10_14_0_2_um_filter_37_12]